MGSDPIIAPATAYYYDGWPWTILVLDESHLPYPPDS
jgi:hypothetical protein